MRGTRDTITLKAPAGMGLSVSMCVFGAGIHSDANRLEAASFKVFGVSL